MTERRALVLIDGKQAELPVGDTLAGAGGGAPGGYVTLDIVDGEVTPDLALGPDFLVDTGAASWFVVRFPDNATPGAAFSITFDIPAGSTAFARWSPEYSRAMNFVGEQILYPGQRTRYGFQVNDRGEAVLLDAESGLTSMDLFAPVGRFLSLTVFSHDGENLDAASLISEIKFGVVGGGVVPPDLTANSDGAFAVWRVDWPGESSAMLDQVGDIYLASDGNPATAFGSYQEGAHGWMIVFDFGAVVELSDMTVTLSRTGLFDLITGVGVGADVWEADVVYATKTTTLGAYGLSVTAGVPVTIDRFLIGAV